jgi:hypothetical protein
MAKKKRTAKRSTKAAKRRSSTKRVAAKRGVFQSGVFQPGVFQGLPPSASQQKLSAAVQSTAAEVNPPHELKAEGLTTASPELGTPPLTVMAGAGGLRADSLIVPPPVSIPPTIYPDSPQGTVIVQNHVTINIQSEEFSRFNKNIEALIGELRQSNEISGEVRDQLLSELRAGGEIITAPKPQHDLINLLLVKPLKWLVDKSGSAIIAKLAGDALQWLLKML